MFITRRPSILGLLLAVASWGAVPAAAELVITTDGHIFKVRAYELLESEDQMRLTLPSGGRLTLPLMRIERVVADEVPLKEEEPELPASPEEPVPAPAPAFSWRFAEDHGVPYTPYGEIIFKLARRHGVNPTLVAAVVKVESAFQTKAISPKGARGLMQLMPATADRFGVKRGELYQPRRNLQAGIVYLKWLLERFQGSLELALAAYNAGEGTVDRYRGVPPFRETRNYVRKIYRLLGIPESELTYLAAGASSAGLARAR